MMNKEQFLAMSLPHGVKIIGNEKLDVVGLMNGRIWFSDGCFLPLINVNCIPILHPLSDLTKEIEHKGDRIHVLTFLCETYRSLDPYQLLAAISFGTVDFNIMMDLIKFHFDICGLIEKGEAIDVNSLSENPYK